MMRAAALCAWSAALGFGLPGLYGTWYLAAHDRGWSFLDFPTYGSGPVEDVGAFWIGFALPVAIALGLARTALALASKTELPLTAPRTGCCPRRR